jgi:hypothetical protein
MCRRVTLRRPERKGQLVAKRSPVQSGVRKVVDAPQRSLSFIIDTQDTGDRRTGTHSHGIHELRTPGPPTPTNLDQPAGRCSEID